MILEEGCFILLIYEFQGIVGNIDNVIVDKLYILV